MTTRDLSYNDIINNIKKYKGYKIIICGYEWEIITVNDMDMILMGCKEYLDESVRDEWKKIFPKEYMYWNVDPASLRFSIDISEFYRAFWVSEELYNSPEFNFIVIPKAVNPRHNCINIDIILNHLNFKLIN